MQSEGNMEKQIGILEQTEVINKELETVEAVLAGHFDRDPHPTPEKCATDVRQSNILDEISAKLNLAINQIEETEVFIKQRIINKL